ncbi:MAG TPA: ABC transporter permease [Vicinamibacteria bacterium]
MKIGSLRERLHSLRVRLRAVLRREEMESDLDDELRFHLAMRQQHYGDSGLGSEDARYAALRRFGNFTAFKEECRDMWNLGPVEGIGRLARFVAQDLRYGVRGLRQQPAFALLAVTTLALGIGAATTIFSVIQNVLLDPFDFSADRLVAIEIRDETGKGRGGRRMFPVPEFLDYKEQVGSFEDVIGGGYMDVVYTTPAGAEQLAGGFMTVNNFSFLGTPAALGRTLEAGDDQPGAPPVFVLTHKAWVVSFGKDPGVIGKSFVLNGVARTCVGVMGPRFYKLGADVYLPAVLDRANEEERRRPYMLQARLRQGVSLEEARTEVALVAERLAKVYPDRYPKRFTARVDSMIDSTVGSFRQTLYTLAAAVGLLLLIACANVANLLLARAIGRERELAVRASLGAGRSRLVLQMLVESLLLALLGAVLGCVLAHFGIRGIVAAIPDGLIPRQAVIRMNWPVLAFSLGVAVLTSVLCGLVPGLRAARRDVVEPLKGSGKGGAGDGARRRPLAGVLVVSEVALSLVLLSGAGLLIRSFMKLQNVELGFEPKGVLIARLAFPPGEYKSAGAGRVANEVTARLAALPGVVAVSTAGTSPPPFGSGTLMRLPGSASEPEPASIQIVGEGFFRTVGARLLRGRLLDEADVAGARKVAVVNQTLVARYFDGIDPLGRAIDLTGLATMQPDPVADPVFEIVGVVADFRNQGIREPALPQAIIPHTVTAGYGRGILLKAQGDARALLNGLEREVWAVDPRVAVTNVELLSDVLDRWQYAEPRLSLVIMSVFAGTGLTLVALGVFSVVAYTVSRRTHEIGIRMALGAERADVVRMVLRMALGLVGSGIALGLLGAVALARVLQAQLFGVTALDPATFASVALVLACVGLLAGYVPALRATRVAPMTALRQS